MSKNAWIVWALILMVPGAVGLSYHYAQQDELREQITAAQAAVNENPAAEEYLAMYQRWVALDPEDKADNPWGQDPYGGPDIQQRVKDGQSDRLTADLAELDKGLKHYPQELAETLYGHRWEQTLRQYRQDRERADIWLIGSIFLLAGGGVIVAGGLSKMILAACLRRLRSDEPADGASEPPVGAECPSPSKIFENTPLALTRSQPMSDMEKMMIARAEAGAAGNAESPADRHAPGYFQSARKAACEDASPADGAARPLPTLSDLKATATATMEKPAKDSYFGWAVDPDEDSLLDTMMTTEPLTKELTGLSEEMSAIREFAAQQQDQVRKFQDGYDWMIVRRFCLRIIRCIDNIDDRIGRLEQPADELAVCLEDIRDELIFALESSGVEQYSPDIHIPFKGLEKYAEAVRQRVPTEDPSRAGCIAELVRPGYQYLVSEEDVKVVRCAQVKLYEAKQS